VLPVQAKPLLTLAVAMAVGLTKTLTVFVALEQLPTVAVTE